MFNDDFGNRMKEYESRNQYYLQKRTPVILRIDGKAFHTFTRGLHKPFDEIFMKSMQETMKYLCENIQGAKLGYCQSDEITLLLTDYDTLETDCWFNYRTDKLCSITASMATLAFNKAFEKNVQDWTINLCYPEDKNILHKNEYEYSKFRGVYQCAINNGAIFDCRCFNIPKEEVANCFYWRQLDATRNSIQMVGQANFYSKELHGKSCSEIKEMLAAYRGIDWENLPTACKRGTACRKVKVVNNDGQLVSDNWQIDTETPVFKNDGRKYINTLVYVSE